MATERDITRRQKARKESRNLITLDFTFGMPPDDMFPETNNIMRNTMPIARIYPGIPSFREGLDLFKVVPAFEASIGSPGKGKVGPPNGVSLHYHPLLKAHGFSIGRNQNYVEVAYLADSFPTDSFTNEYGENFLQKFTDVASEGAASLAQIAGGRSVTEAYTRFAGNLAKKEGALGAVGTGALKAGDIARELFSALPGGGQAAVHTIDKLMAGGRIDFPMVWKSSGFQPSYTMTIRLYNPAPESFETTRKYIIGPIAALMLLGIPISADGNTYSWPFLHRIYSPGIYDLDPAFISNITVVKGGDQQQIAQNQRLSIVDVRIDFGSLFSSMLASPRDIGKSRPTLKKYLDGIASDKEVTDRLGNTLRNPKVVQSPTTKIPKVIREKTQTQKSNPESRETNALSKVLGAVSTLSALQRALQDAIETLNACDRGDTTCIVSAQNLINKIQARINQLTN